ncbi:SRPBCC family protein [Streptomyces sp. NPDC054849]
MSASATTSEHDLFEVLDASDFTFTRRAWVDAAPARVYDLVSDVSAIGRWSPNASDVTFDQGAGPRGRGLVQRPQPQGRQAVDHPLPGRTGRPRRRLRLRGRRRRGRHRAMELDLQPPGTWNRHRAVLATPAPRLRAGRYPR